LPNNTIKSWFETPRPSF